MLLYHFTAKAHLPAILMDEMLRPSESNVGSPAPELPPFGLGWGPDVVWLLDTETVAFDHGLYVKQTGKNQVRFAVEVRAVRWLDWAPAAQMHPEWRRIMIESAGGEEAATHWYVYPGAIRSRRWASITDMYSGEVIEWDQDAQAAVLGR